jgi:hypothetical protein
LGEPSETDERDLDFAAALPLSPSAEVALEDYARVLVGAEAACALHSRDAVRGVRLWTTRPPSPAQSRDIEDFARGLAAQGGAGGLGWS